VALKNLENVEETDERARTQQGIPNDNSVHAIFLKTIGNGKLKKI